MLTNKILMLCLVISVAGVGLYVLLAPFLAQSARANERRLAIVRGETKKVNASRDTEAAARRKQVTDSLKDLENRDKRTAKVTMEMKLEQAGLATTVRTFIIASCISGAVLGLVTLIVLGPLFAMAALLVGGVGLPNWFVNYLRAKRIKDFLKEFPVAIEVIIRGVKSGFPP